MEFRLLNRGSTRLWLFGPTWASRGGLHRRASCGRATSPLPCLRLLHLALCLDLHINGLAFEDQLTVTELRERDIFHFQMILKNDLVDFGFSLWRKVVIADLNFSNAEIAGKGILERGGVALIHIIARDIQSANVLI